MEGVGRYLFFTNWGGGVMIINGSPQEKIKNFLFEVTAKWVDLMIARPTTILEIQKLLKMGWKPTNTYQSIVYKLENAITQCCKSMRSNVQEVLSGMFLPAPLALSSGPYLFDPCKKDETQKISGFYQSLALQHLRPKDYKKCMKLPYDLYCRPRKQIMPITCVHI